jgi:hypothetical protein
MAMSRIKRARAAHAETMGVILVAKLGLRPTLGRAIAKTRAPRGKGASR